MEFKIRATDDRPSRVSIPSSSNVSHVSEQAVLAGFTEFRRNELLRNPNDMREVIQREIEKERIREEIIASEITRKRLLEAEVRRELMIERALSLGTTEGLSLHSSLSASRVPFLLQPAGGSLEERLSRSLEERFWRSFEERISLQAHREVGNIPFEVRPFHCPLEAAQTPDVKPLAEARKGKLITLAKHEVNVCGGKRKAGGTVSASGGVSSLKKKPKEEWSCALCQVTVTNERCLNEHLEGRKHKAKEAGLRAQKTVKKSSSVVPLAKTKTAETLTLKEKASVQEKENVNAGGDSGKKNDEAAALLPVKEVEEDPKADKGVEGPKKKTKKVKKLNFLCDICHIGAYSDAGMINHKKGKKHLAKVEELTQNVLAKKKDAQVADAAANKEANEKLNANVEDTTLVKDGSGSLSQAN